jgi:hypothetical protein
MKDYNRREMLGLSLAGVAGMTRATGQASSLPARDEAGDGDGTAPIKTRMLWTWDHSTEWALNRPGAQTMGAMNPYFRSPDVFVEDYTRLLDWSGKHHIDAVVVWGLLRDSHGGVEAAKKLCDVAARNGVRLLAGVGLCAYGGVYYEGGSPQSMRVHLNRHPELRASNESGRPIVANMMACPSRKENRDYVAALQDIARPWRRPDGNGRYRHLLVQIMQGAPQVPGWRPVMGRHGADVSVRDGRHSIGEPRRDHCV